MASVWERSTADEIRAALRARGYTLRSATWDCFAGWHITAVNPSGNVVVHDAASTKRAMQWVAGL